MADILYAPNRERVITTNAWAFLHWLRTTRGIALADWTALQRFRWSGQRSSAPRCRFSRLPPVRLRSRASRGRRRPGVPASGWVHALLSAATRSGDLSASPPPPAGKGRGRVGRNASSLQTWPHRSRRLWPSALLIRPLADLLLHADLRPDDRLLVSARPGHGSPHCWRAPPSFSRPSLDADCWPPPPRSVPLFWLPPRRPRPRPRSSAPATVRISPTCATIIATGGPLSPEGRRRVYTWVKSDLMLLARTGDTFWGNPLEPVLARPPATPALLTPPASDPATP